MKFNLSPWDVTLYYNVDGGISGLLGHGPFSNPLLCSCEKHSVANRKSGSDSAGLGSGGETLPLVTSCRDTLKRSGLPVLISIRQNCSVLDPVQPPWEKPCVGSMLLC